MLRPRSGRRSTGSAIRDMRDWRAIRRSLPSGLLSSQSTIVRVLGGRDLDVQHLASEDIEAAPADLVNVLDAKLQSLLLEIATLRVRH